MKAIIMAGGEGSRLRPLTCDLPKPMARLCGRPMIEYILDLLWRHGFRQADVTVRYLPEAITDRFPDGEYRGIELRFFEEDRPLGTAGSVRHAAGDTDETVLVISGDALCDFDLTEAMRYHERTGSDATLLLKQVEDPREYGLVNLDGTGRITGFLEKPSYSQAVSDLANTGIYLLSPRALELIPRERAYDFAGDLFPLMLGRGMRLMGLRCEGYWCDIGDLESYRRCQLDLLEGRVDCELPGERDQAGNRFLGGRPEGDYTIEPPVYLGRDVYLGEGTVLGRGTVVDDGCEIQRGARVSGSILLPDSSVGEEATLTGAIVCAEGTVKRRAMLFEGSAVGSGAVIGEKAQLGPEVKVWNQKMVPAACVVREHVKTGSARREYFDDEGISGEVGAELTPEFLARLGCAVGSAGRGKKIGVGCSDDRSGRVLCQALVSGIRSAGASVLDFGSNFEALFQFGCAFCGVGIGVFVKGGREAAVRLTSEYGLPSTRALERSVEGRCGVGEFLRCSYDRFGASADLSAMATFYGNELLRLAPAGLEGMAVQLESSNRKLLQLVSSTLEKLGCRLGSGPVATLSAQGDAVAIADPGAGTLTPNQVLALCCLGEFQEGRSVPVRFDAPRSLDLMAEPFGAQVKRYFQCPADPSDAEAREMLKRQLWPRDGAMLLVRLLARMKKTGRSLQALCEELPRFAQAEQIIALKENPARVMRELSQGRPGAIEEGVTLREKEGIVLIRPLKRGGGLRVLAESSSSETAAELCDGVMKRLQEQGRLG